MFLVYFNFFRLTVGIVATVRIYTYEWLIFSILYNLAASWLIMIYCIFYRGVITFRNNQIRNFITYLIVVYTSQSTAFFLDQLSRIFRLFGENFEGALPFTVVVSIMMSYSVHYLSLKQQEAILMESNIKNLNPGIIELKIFFLIILNDRSAQDRYDDNVFKGLIQNHIRKECPHPIDFKYGKCFCKMKYIFDPKK